MKKFFGILSACLLAITSCSNFNETSSLSLTFNGSDFAQKSSARNILVTSDYEGYYLVLNLLGDYTERKEIPFSAIENYTVTFDSIPVGSDVYVEANVYNPNSDEFTHLYNGTSEKISVSSGANSVNLSMKSLTKGISREDEVSYYYSEFMFFSLPEVDSDNINGIYFFNNGKFILYHLIGSDDPQLTVISEGFWSGDKNAFTDGGIIQVTEYLYRTYSYSTPPNDDYCIFGDAVIVTDFKTSNIEFTKDNGIVSFSSRNGLEFWPQA